MQWIWESYQINSKLYKELEQSNKLRDEYYQSHIGTANERLEMAGILLAGLLNRIFKNMPLPSLKEKESASNSNGEVAINSASNNDDSDAGIATIAAADASKHIGERVSVIGKVYDGRDMQSFYLLNLGAAYPDQLLTVVLRGETKSLAAGMMGKTIKATGKVISYKGKPEIEVRNAKSIVVVR